MLLRLHGGSVRLSSYEMTGYEILSEPKDITDAMVKAFYEEIWRILGLPITFPTGEELNEPRHHASIPTPPLVGMAPCQTSQRTVGVAPLGCENPSPIPSW